MRRLIAIAAATLLLPGLAVAQDLTGALKKIKESGSIAIGTRESSVPFSYIDDQGKAVGFAMDICAAIVDAVKVRLGLNTLQVVYTPVTSSTRIPLIANGTIDLECGSTTNNAERQKQVSFTNTHFLTASAFVSKADRKLTRIDDLKGKTVVSTAGTTNMKQLVEANTARNLNITVLSAKDHAAAFLMVETDRADAFVMDDVLLASLVASSKTPSAYQLSEEAFSLPEPYGIMVPKDDPAFKAVADKATAELYQSPKIVELYAKWFLSPIPPRGINLNMPMSAKLKRAFANPTDSPDPAAY